MSIVILIIQALILVIFAYFVHYFQEKGKNLATKEDISEITTKIEQVKHTYSSKLESVKSVLSARLFTHQVRYQNEFVMLLSLSKKLAEFKDALSNFELQIASLGVGADNPNYTKETIEKALASMGALQDEYEAHLPFYPQDIYENVKKLHSLGWKKLVLKANKANLTERNELGKIIIESIKKKRSRFRC